MSDVEVRQAGRSLRALAALAEEVATRLSGPVVEAADLAASALEAGHKLLFCGNGGSAADAQHLATEYVVRFRADREPLRALALTTDTSLLTAASNDYGFDQVFARQLRGLGTAGDVLFLHSISGRSPNLLAAARAAHEMGIRTVALLGGGGGPLRRVVDLAIVIPTQDGARAQELQLALGHVICGLVERRLMRSSAG
jgi:D-sedoheptulose 7-phosphate isomerase